MSAAIAVEDMPSTVQGIEVRELDSMNSLWISPQTMVVSFRGMLIPYCPVVNHHLASLD